MHQTTFFDALPSNGTYTSGVAAQRKKRTAAQQRERVLKFIQGCGAEGCIREDICTALHLTGDSVRPRVWELVKQGLIEDTCITRPTLSGRPAFVLKARNQNGV